MAASGFLSLYQNVLSASLNKIFLSLSIIIIIINANNNKEGRKCFI